MAIGRIPEPGTGIPESIVDAKGDIVTATAADTPARLAVGTNDYRLVAASGEATGLKYVADTQNTVADAKGDLLVGTGADTIARLAVGTNGHTLVADSAEATGLKWQAAASSAKNYSLINSGGTSLSGSSTSITGISAKDSLLVVVIGASCTAGSIEIQMTINSDTAANYTNQQNAIVAPASYNTNNFSGGGGYSNGTSIEIGRESDVAASVVNSSVFINGANSAGDKVYQVVGGGSPAGNDGQRLYWGAGVWENSSTVSSIQIKASGGTFDAGTVYIWGSA
jgi:hypothetical protein